MSGTRKNVLVVMAVLLAMFLGVGFYLAQGTDKAGGALSSGPIVVGTQPSIAPASSPAENTCAPGTYGNTPFVAIGDSGSGASFQYNVGKRMYARYQAKPYPFVLMLGDNIYPDGNIQQHKEDRFEKPYAPLLKAGVKFLPVLGNHDVLRHYEDDQMAYFNMPNEYYTCRQGDVEIFFINTNTFWGSEKQQEWLDEKLARSEAAWKIVIGHHPIYTSGEHHGETAIVQLRKDLEPLLVKHGVPLYLAGHDHDYERFAPINGVTHIISGGAGAWLRDFEAPQPHSLVREKKHHFVYFEPSRDALKFTVIDSAGAVIDQGQLVPMT